MRGSIIHLVRHGQVYNPNNIVYGRLPRFRLSERGRLEACAAAHFLRNRPIAAVYSSPQLRARQTAELIARHSNGLQVRVSKFLAEVKTGWQGVPNHSIGKLFNFYDPPASPGDESIDDVFRRLDRLIQRLINQYPGQEIVCVSHGDPIMIARTGYSGQDLLFENLRRGGYPETGSITTLEFISGKDLPIISYCSPAWTDGPRPGG